MSVKQGGKVAGGLIVIVDDFVGKEDDLCFELGVYLCTYCEAKNLIDPLVRKQCRS